MKKGELEGDLPRGFLNVTVKKGKLQFSSLELVSSSAPLQTRQKVTSPQKKMNARMKDALDETLILSNK